jgi:kumamolisin
MKRSNCIAVPGSERKPVAGAKSAGPVDATKQIGVTVRLRARAVPSDQTIYKEGATLPAQRTVLSREEYSAQYGAAPEDLKAVEDFAREHGLSVVRSSAAQRSVRLKGTVAALNEAFGVKLKKFQSASVSYRGRTGPVYIPKSLEGIVVGVHGLDNRPVAKPHFRLRPVPDKSGKQIVFGPRNAQDGSLTAPEVAKLYNFPTDLDGTGQCIALIELNDTDQSGKPTGAGYSVSDLKKYFKGLGIAAPTVKAVSVDGGANVPKKDQNADGEVTLDIEVAGAVAPGATIAVYFAPNSTSGFIDAVNAAVHDTKLKPSVISISWGGPEDAAGEEDSQFLQGLNQALQAAAQIGVTVCCASGDNGSADMAQQWDGKPHTDFPASSPFSLACGGTKLTGSGTQIASEVVWNEGTRGGAGGGGVSNVFGLPTYQSKVKVPQSPKKKKGRGVPDVAGNADPFTGYRIVLGGNTVPIGGTSAVAPLMAGLIALINQSLAKKSGATAGFLNPLLYESASSFRDITSGNNDMYGKLKGTYKAGPGWDACTGMGVPDGEKLRVALGA